MSDPSHRTGPLMLRLDLQQDPSGAIAPWRSYLRPSICIKNHMRNIKTEGMIRPRARKHITRKVILDERVDDDPRLQVDISPQHLQRLGRTEAAHAEVCAGRLK